MKTMHEAFAIGFELGTRHGELSAREMSDRFPSWSADEIDAARQGTIDGAKGDRFRLTEAEFYSYAEAFAVRDIFRDSGFNAWVTHGRERVLVKVCATEQEASAVLLKEYRLWIGPDTFLPKHYPARGEALVDCPLCEETDAIATIKGDEDVRGAPYQYVAGFECENGHRLHDLNPSAEGQALADALDYLHRWRTDMDSTRGDL
jgi:hypothetical protein